MPRIAMIGAGNFSNYVSHIAAATHEIVGYFCNQRPLGTIAYGLPVLGTIDDVEQVYANRGFDMLLSGIGYLQFQYRKESFERFIGKIPFATIIHPRAFVDRSCTIGEGSVVQANCMLDKGVHVGANVFLGPSTTVAHESRIDAHCIASCSVAVAGFSNIGECCFLGAGSVVRDETTVCDHARIGAGSVVVFPVKKPEVYHFGIPAIPFNEL